MNRRNFCQTILLSPLLSPLFLGLKSVRGGGQLYLISDTPHLFLPKILHELEKYTLTERRGFTILDSSPVERRCREALLQHGWTQVFSPARASLILSIHHLLQKVAPSFTLINHGHVLDIRSKTLSSLWAQINTSGLSSSLLVTVCFNNQNALSPPGKEVHIYSDGALVSKLSLKKDVVKTFNNPKGSITIHISGHKAWVSHASCLHQVCRYTPPVSSSGEQIICAPGHFLVEIDGAPSIDTVIG